MRARFALCGLSVPLLLATTLACPAKQPSDPAPASSPKPNAEPSKPEPSKPEPSKPAPDPDLAAKLADLDDMCKAVDRDYGDGTLGDYYAGLAPRTTWGKQQLAAGNESIKPGRLLEQAVAELGPAARELPHCRKLLDYLDEVE